LWAKSELNASVPDQQTAERRRKFLTGLPERHQEGDFLFVHGSPRNPLYEYVVPEDIHNQRKLDRIFALVDRYCFQGHTHVPGILTESRQYYSTEEVNCSYRLDGRKTLCNVGSVGQPRDEDWRACYLLLLDGELLRYRRIAYDVETTVRKIRENENLDDVQAQRLREGR